ncbi:EthD domain-containing protein [Sphingomonas sp.]|uniref:EthD domain-containing protein n=1 Tax=Sphingomonas sp. TaxID=28214 RepID=UPI00325FC4C1
MIKALAFLVKLPRLSDAAFFGHWRHPHGTLTRRIPQFRRYVQNHRIGDVPGFATGPWLGVPAIWLDDLAALADAQVHPEYAPLDADGDNMYIRDRTVWLVGNETIVRAQAADAAAMPIKAILMLGNGTALADAAAVLDLTKELAETLSGIVGASVTLPVDPTAPSPCAALIELSFGDCAAFDAAWDDGRAVLNSVARLADLPNSHGILVREERVIWPKPSGDC